MSRLGFLCTASLIAFVVTLVLLFNIFLNYVENLPVCSKPEPIVVLDKLYLLRYCDKDVSSDKTECLHNGTEFECYTSPKSTVVYE